MSKFVVSVAVLLYDLTVGKYCDFMKSQYFPYVKACSNSDILIACFDIMKILGLHEVTFCDFMKSQSFHNVKACSNNGILIYFCILLGKL